MLQKILLTVFIFLTSSLLLFAQPIHYTNANNNWNADSLGNHRAVLQFDGIGTVAKVHIEWRRRDYNPALKRIIVQDGRTGRKILNVKTLELNREFGDICFEPISGKGVYYVYYMPYKNEGRANYPKGVYLSPENTAYPTWLESFRPEALALHAHCYEIQSINAFNSFYPMEVIATKKETNALLKKFHQSAFLVFPEDRDHSIRMKDDLPQRWVMKGVTNQFKGEADRGENYTYQLGVYALQNLEGLTVSFSNLKSKQGNLIAAKDISCINTDGISYDDKILKNKIDLQAGKVQALWCALTIPESLPAAVYKGTATVKALGKPETNIAVSITVNNRIAIEGNIAHPERMTRLHWLNSTMAQENKVIAPYTPLQINDNVVSLLGRKLQINEDGLPKQVQTFFTEEMTGYTTEPNNELTEPIHFHFIRQSDGQSMKWEHQGLKFTEQSPGTVKWQAISSNDSLLMEVSASMEFDGFISYSVKITALQDIDLKDIAMHIPFKMDAAKYMMGLGQKGGLRPDSVIWKWDVAHKNQDGAWLGNVNQGLQYSLRDERYARPLNTNFYLQKPLLLPSSWGNENKGGITIAKKGNAILANNYSGPRSMKKGDTLFYNFNLLITPFHPINTDFQWKTRFYHRYNNVDSIKATGATVINIHHATPINPWINYPFIEWKKMKDYIDSAHRLGLKVKIYNTIRELSDHAYETFALRSLGHEVYSSGKGGGFSWLQEHLGDDYIAAWFVPEIKDAAIVNSGMNRWHNYYVEGMNWLVQHVGIDGIYLDDVAFDRVTMKRIKRVLTEDGHPGIIDLHSANQYNKNDGFNNSAMLYMEHFPYLNRLWFGEYFDYEHNSPGFFLTEVSGIPFGLMGEMLQGGGNPWRGMIYGMTNRMPWSDNADPRPIWKLWDEFGMQGTEMIGYWSSHCPVKTDHGQVLTTVYKKNGAALLAIASWADTNVDAQLQIDWKALGIDKERATIEAPFVKNFQPAKTFMKGEAIPIAKGKGIWLIIKEK
ncbi:MAG: hypothetical protein JST58_12700 [Bacteroidetes bacterium]|nr:hypothetical protein [Bacteroidota bacterium]